MCEEIFYWDESGHDIIECLQNTNGKLKSEIDELRASLKELRESVESK